jgi:hypothetical protein
MAYVDDLLYALSIAISSAAQAAEDDATVVAGQPCSTGRAHGLIIASVRQSLAGEMRLAFMGIRLPPGMPDVDRVAYSGSIEDLQRWIAVARSLA